jgi:hypothetical protein
MICRITGRMQIHEDSSFTRPFVFNADPILGHCHCVRLGDVAEVSDKEWPEHPFHLLTHTLIQEATRFIATQAGQSTPIR